MRIHLADSSNERGQYALLSECLFPNHLASFAYPRIFEYFEKSWDELVRIHLVSKPSSNSGLQTKALVEAEVKSHLLSFAFQGEEHPYSPIWSNAGLKPQSDPKSDLRPRVIVDSGAFTAWSTGKAIRPQDYAEWALKFDSRWRAKMASLRYINLDYIPGTKGVSATAEQLKEATEKSMLNADFLRASGLSPVIEVFHQDEPFELIKKLEDRRQGGCIALSPRNDVSVQKRAQWLTKVLHYCVKTFGRDRIPPAHGLAVTTEQLLKVFPFYSVDSSSWVACLRYGEGGSSGLKRLPRYKTSDAALAATLHTLRSEIRKYQKMEQDMTKLWTLRGIEWNESEIR